MITDIFLNHTLTFLIVIPLIFGLMVLAIPRILTNSLFTVSTIITTFTAVYIYVNFTSGVALNFFDSLEIIPKYGINYSVALTYTSFIIMLIISVVIPTTCLFMHMSRVHLGLMLISQSIFYSVISSVNLIFFYAGWELMLIPLFIMIGLYSNDNKKGINSAIKMLYYAMAGSLIMLFSILYIGYEHYVEFGKYSFALSDLVNLKFSSYEETILFFMFMIALAIKAPLFPFHMWLRDAYVNSPTSVTILLSTIASKVAIFGMITFLATIFNNAYVYYSDLIIIIALFSMIYFGITAIMQKDLKSVLSYASASHLGLIVAGLFSISKYRVIGFDGSIFLVVAHSLSSAMLFLVGYHLFIQFKSRQISSLVNVTKDAPLASMFFMISLLSAVGLPSTAGFVGELYIIIIMFRYYPLVGFFTVFTVILGSIYMFRIFKNGFLKSDDSITVKIKDLSLSKVISMLILSILIFTLGIYPKLITDKSDSLIYEYGLRSRDNIFIKYSSENSRDKKSVESFSSDDSTTLDTKDTMKIKSSDDSTTLDTKDTMKVKSSDDSTIPDTKDTMKVKSSDDSNNTRS